ncbi:hypothetical protein [Paenibacillus sp.]|nr:hypothetical protein [Paenibacillus sp.]HZG87269.1 hypothetical protein [Paenibacillus sp.]
MNEQISTFICKFVYLNRLVDRVRRIDAVASNRRAKSERCGASAGG